MSDDDTEKMINKHVEEINKNHSKICKNQYVCISSSEESSDDSQCEDVPGD